jgi:hypothetical protein
MRRVLVEGWQFQCCGERFEVGSTISWTVAANPDRAFLADVLGAEGAASITDIEDHHVELLRDEPVVGTVRAITALFCSYAMPSASAKGLYPVRDTAVLEARDRADGREREEGNRRVFLGYLVDVDEEPERTEQPLGARLFTDERTILLDDEVPRDRARRLASRHHLVAPAIDRTYVWRETRDSVRTDV